MNLFKLVGSIFIDTSQSDEAMTETEKRAAGLGQKFKDVAGGMAGTGAAVAAGVGVIAGALLSSAMDADAASAQMQASLGYTKDQADALVNSAREIYKNGFGESLGEVSQGLIDVKEQMQGVNDADLGGVTQQAMVLAQTLDEDVGAVARSADMLMTQFGISSSKAFDLLAVGQQKGLNFSGEFLDSVNEYSAQFKNMGYSAEEAFAIMVSGSENGAFNLDKIGDAVKENFLRLSDMGKGQIDTMGAIGLNATDVMAKINAGGDSAKQAYTEVMTTLAGMKDETARNAAGVQLFGTQWEDLGQKVVMSMNPSVEVLGQVEGAAAKAGEALSNSVSQQATAVWREFKDSVAPLGAVLLDMAQDAFPAVSSAVQGLTGFFAGMSPIMQKVVVGGGLIVGALGALMVIIAPIITAIGTLIPLFAGAGISIAAIATPIVLAIAAIGLLIATGTKIYKNWDEIKANCAAIWGSITDSLSKATKAAGQSLSDGWESTKSILSHIWSSTVDGAKAIWGGVANAVSSGTNAAVNFFINTWNQGVSNVKAIWSSLSSAASSAWNSVVSAVQSVTENAKNVLVTGWNQAKEILSGVWSAISTAARTYFDIVVSIVRGIVSTIKAIFSGDFQSIPEIWRGVFNSIKNIVSDVKDKVVGYIQSMTGGLDGIVDKIGGAINKAKEFLGLDGGGGLFSSVGNFVMDKVGRNAFGTDDYEGGLTVVGEQGRELVNLPKGSQVVKNRDTEKILNSGQKVEQHLHFYNTGTLSSSEVARKTRYANQELALNLNM